MQYSDLASGPLLPSPVGDWVNPFGHAWLADEEMEMPVLACVRALGMVIILAMGENAQITFAHRFSRSRYPILTSVEQKNFHHR